MDIVTYILAVNKAKRSPCPTCKVKRITESELEEMWGGKPTAVPIPLEELPSMWAGTAEPSGPSTHGIPEPDITAMWAGLPVEMGDKDVIKPIPESDLPGMWG